MNQVVLLHELPALLARRKLSSVDSLILSKTCCLDIQMLAHVDEQNAKGETMLSCNSWRTGFKCFLLSSQASLAQFIMRSPRGEKILIMCSYIHFTQSHGRKSVSHLPDPDHSIGDEDEKNNNRLNKGGGCFLSLLKQSQHLHEHTGHVTLADILYCNSRSPTVA